MEVYTQLASGRLEFALNLSASVVIAIVVGCAVGSAQDVNDKVLTRSLANDSTRPSAVAEVLASGNAKAPLLLEWTQKPPAEVDQYGLYIGLADAFGQLRTKEAIPFLIKNISRRRTRHVDFAPWLKAPEVIKDTFPALAALIQIGPDASRALIRAFREPMLDEDRLASIFAISRIRGVPEARAFLTSVIGEANTELQYAEEGLKLSDGSR
jgi:hypothetical protein